MTYSLLNLTASKSATHSDTKPDIIQLLRDSVYSLVCIMHAWISSSKGASFQIHRFLAR